MWSCTGSRGAVRRARPWLQVREALAAVAAVNRDASAVRLQEATVTAVETLGIGDRVCVDLCSNMVPGEGLLVGNFCRALFLVHSEVRAPPTSVTVSALCDA